MVYFELARNKVLAEQRTYANDTDICELNIRMYL